MTNQLQQAASVILVRDEPTFQSLMIERHRDIAFAGGALVFPGGRVNDEDSHPSWRQHATGLSEDAELAAAQIAAIRETYEEVGIVLARPRDEERLVSTAITEALSPFREAVDRGQASFLSIIRDHEIKLACDQLTLFAHWVGPRMIPRRFDTRFFVVRAPVDQAAMADGREATEAVWIRPSDAVDDGRSGARHVIFPTMRNLELLALATSSDLAVSACRSRTISPIEPEIETRADGDYLTIPRDPARSRLSRHGRTLEARNARMISLCVSGRQEGRALIHARAWSRSYAPPILSLLR